MRRAIKTIEDLNFTNKKVLLRVDFNVSLRKQRVGDDTRIRQAIPTIKYLLKNQASVILVTHLGRPKGKRSKRLSVAPVAKKLHTLLGTSVRLIDDFTKKEDRQTILSLKPKQVVILENIRFYPQEERNDPKFAKQLASLADIYVNDSFGVNHRVHASTVGVSEHLTKAAGLLLKKEIEMISRLTNNPKPPFVAIIGGAKAETKITLIDKLLESADQLLIGGGIANTFFKAWGFEIGNSLANYEMVELAKSLIWKASQSNTALVLPQDVVIGSLKHNKITKVVPSHKIPQKSQVVDIGPRAQAQFGSIITNAKTIVWNGPLGIYEKSKFSIGTNFIYHAIATNSNAFSVIGGGDTLASLPHSHSTSYIDHHSTGGGSLLEFIEKGTLPAIEALRS